MAGDMLIRMPSSAPPSSATPRRRSEAKSRRRPEHGLEIRAAVTHTVYNHVDKEAERLGRSRSWHAGLYVEALGRVDQKLTPAERALLDELLRNDPERLLEPIRSALAKP
jgi:hypothetical protein